MTFGKLLKTHRLEKRLTQEELGRALRVTGGYICNVELDKAQPSDTFKELAAIKLGIGPEEFGLLPISANGKKTKRSMEEATKKYLSHALLVASVSAPVAPWFSGSVAIGAGATTVIARMVDAFGARNESELAEKLGVSRSRLSNWKKRNSIPREPLLKAAEETGHSINWFTTDELTINRSLLKSIIQHVEEEAGRLKMHLNAKVKAGIVAMLYDQFRGQEEINSNQLGDLMILLKDAE